MARAKNKKVRKAAKDSTFPSGIPSQTEPAKFHLNRLPAELVHMIFGYLNPVEVASIRIIGSNIAAIGLEYIATTVTLTLKEDSFDRLLKMAHHPVISKHVHSLRYEHDFLTSYDRKHWESFIRTPTWFAFRSGDSELGAPWYGASRTARRAFHRKWLLLKAYNTYGKKRLDQAFLTYQNDCAEQVRAWRSNFFSQKLAAALQHLPNLRTIHMPAHGSYSRYQTEMAEILNGAFYDQHVIESNSVDVTRSILLAVAQAILNGLDRSTQAARLASNDQASTSLGLNELGNSKQRGLRMENFSSESFNWRLLLEGDEVFTVIKRSMTQLTKLGIHFLDGDWIKDGEDSFYSRNDGRYPSDIEAPRECLRRRLYEFVKSAPCLEALHVSFALNNHFLTIYLTDVIGSFHWASLKTVHFRRIQITIGSLEDFCLRHSSTLSDLSLGDLQMGVVPPYQGRRPWYSVFSQVREATKLKKATVYGIFTLGYIWNMHDRPDVRRASGTLIGRYLVGDGGSSSLENFMKEERSRIAKQERGSISNVDDVSSTTGSTSGFEDSSSESDA